MSKGAFCVDCRKITISKALNNVYKVAEEDSSFILGKAAERPPSLFRIQGILCILKREKVP